MLDRDLAELYGVETKRLKEQVRRNIERFSRDFMFDLTKQDLKKLEVAICDLKLRRYVQGKAICLPLILDDIIIR